MMTDDEKAFEAMTKQQRAVCLLRKGVTAARISEGVSILAAGGLHSKPPGWYAYAGGYELPIGAHPTRMDAVSAGLRWLKAIASPSAYTPGPLTPGSETPHCVWLGGLAEPECGMGDSATWIDCRSVANANLVAAAPDMLAALRAALACGLLPGQQGAAAAQQIQAAIRKATGGSHDADATGTNQPRRRRALW